MSLDLNLNAGQTPDSTPRSFVRGQTFEFLLELPATVPASWFGNGTTISTMLAAQLRRKEQSGAGGLIADLAPTWEAGTNCTKIRFLVADTANWPLGPAEFDVLFVRTVTGTGANVRKYRSLPVQIEIRDGITAGS